ncbi:hypothetical protein AB0O51_21635 [Streptomyces sp. NPDC090301]|uniref:hypothetical protein n=1 Tax=Streptomyces sp. NPDC090301 TaxID=3154975 RepID=UPI003448CDFD
MGVPSEKSPLLSGGRARHAVRGQLATPAGRRCRVDLSRRRARKLRDVPRKGDRVYIWGKRPGS